MLAMLCFEGILMPHHAVDTMGRPSEHVSVMCSTHQNIGLGKSQMTQCSV